MKKSVKLIILFAVLAVAVGGYILVSRLFSDKEKELVTYPVAEFDASAVSDVEWSRRDSGGKALSRDGEKWVYRDDSALPVDGDKVTSMLSALAGAVAGPVVKETREGADLSSFGLDEPYFSVTAKTADGTSVTVKLGELNDYSGKRYLVSTALEGVYLADAAFADGFPSDERELVLKETVPSPAALVSYTVKNGETVSTVKHYSSGNPDYYTDTYKYFLVSGDKETPVDPSVADGIYSALFNLSWQSVAAYNVKDEDLALYGLDAPVSEVTATYTVTETVSKQAEDGSYGAETETHDETYTLCFGSDAEDGVYARLGEGNIVYTVSGATADEFRFDLRTDLDPAELLYLAKSEITRVEITSGADKYDLSSTVSTSTDDDGDEVRNVTWTLNGSEDGAQEIFDNAFDALNSLDIVAQKVKAPALPLREPDITVRVFPDGKPEITAVFYTDGNGDYICMAPDGVIKTVSGEAVSALREAFAQ
ncbi:MAG: DUF4340 domain-containing protein [Clostridia bacterium]|nr:DUF4340 domain-containing protein [Clostridia bacterium]